MTPILILIGGLSVYHPNDGFNSGELACGGKFKWDQHHIAIREWRKVGCGAIAKVCIDGPRRHNQSKMPKGSRRSGKGSSASARARHQVYGVVSRTQRRSLYPIGMRDAPKRPQPIQGVRVRSRHRSGHRRCIWTEVRDSGPWGAVDKHGNWEVQIKLKKGWRRRGVVDLSWAVWKELGKPRFLTKAHVTIYKAEKRYQAWQINSIQTVYPVYSFLFEKSKQSFANGSRE